MTERELLAWLRPTEILLEDEIRGGAMPRFVQLFSEQLALIAGDRTATVAELFAARRISAAMWQFDRLTSDGRVQRIASMAGNRQAQRAEHFAEAEIKARLTRLLEDDIADAHDFARACKNVIPIAVAVPLREVS